MTSLNASLLSNLHDFLDAVQKMLANHGVNCPIMVVRGDGSIVKTDFARYRPVEMIHSGPATSAIGGQCLADIDTTVPLNFLAFVKSSLEPILTPYNIGSKHGRWSNYCTAQ